MRLVYMFFVLSLGVMGCRRGDGELQQQLAGTWVIEMSQDTRCTRVVQPDGRWHVEITTSTNRILETMDGTLLIKAGDLIDTITKHSNTNATLPRVTYGRIIRLDDRKFISRWEGQQDDTVAHKVPR